MRLSPASAHAGPRYQVLDLVTELQATFPQEGVLLAISSAR